MFIFYKVFVELLYKYIYIYIYKHTSVLLQIFVLCYMQCYALFPKKSCQQLRTHNKSISLECINLYFYEITLHILRFGGDDVALAPTLSRRVIDQDCSEDSYLADCGAIFFCQ
jgi:hypothetical protein